MKKLIIIALLSLASVASAASAGTHNAPFTGCFSTTDNPVVGQPVSFQTQVTVPFHLGAIRHEQWYAADGDPQSYLGAVFVTTFYSAGIHTVTVTYQSTVASCSVTVNP